jgi:glyoxylase-like metal-dependent hydrolase (beta-lactamase superfamily II)
MKGMEMRMTLLALLSACVLAVGCGTTAWAASPGIAAQSPASVYRFMVGDVRVSALSDGTVPINLHDLLRGITPEQTDVLLAHSYMSNPVEASITAFLLEVGSRRVLVDTGAGELFGAHNAGRLPETLRAAGVSLDQIEDVLITHVHTDHSGGLTVAGKMLFPNATIHVGKPDLDYFLDKTNAAKTHYAARYFDEAAVTLKPYVDAGKVKAFAGRSELLPGIVGEVHPGHTPGSAFYTLTSRGESVVFIGDIIHAAAVQFPEPRVTITFDQNPSRAREVRLSAFSRFAAEGTLIAAPHLPFPGVGHIRAEGAGYRWYPVEYADRAGGDTNSTSQLEQRLKSGS